MNRKILEPYGIRNTGVVFRNLSTPALYAESVRNREGFIAHLGPYVVRTGQHTGRSPRDRFIVKEPTTEKKIWWGKENRPFDRDKFDSLYYRALAYLQGKQLYIQDCYAGADRDYRMRVRVINETAWHNMFARNMFIRMKDSSELDGFEPEFTVIHVPNFHADPELDTTNSEAFVILNFEKRLVIIGGTAYAGEIKKHNVGSMISMASGKALGFSLFNLQTRGSLYIKAATEVYEGMVIGNVAKGNDLSVNPTKGKKLSNVRASGTDEAITLTPPIKLTLERGMGIMKDDEYLEITPESIRLRKKLLTENERIQAGRKK